MRALRQQSINDFMMLLRGVLPSRFNVHAWAIGVGAYWLRVEIHVGKRCYWDEFPVDLIASSDRIEVIANCMKNGLPRIHRLT